MQNKYLYPLLFLALLPVLIFRDFTPDNELRYLSIADEALRNGDFFTFTNQGVAYADKPPLYLWLVMLGKWLLGGHYMWFLSLFSILPAFVLTQTMDRWVGRSISEENRFTGKLLLLSCGLFLGLGVVLRMDMLMCMFIVLALHTFFRMLKEYGDGRLNAILFPVYIFMAVFSKGPVGLLVPLLATLIYLLLTHRIRQLSRFWGWTTWGILLFGCLLWFGGVYLEGGPEYLNNLLFHQTVDRAVSSFHHDEPFYYYLIAVWYSLAPWSLLLIGVIVGGIYKRRVRSDLQHFFLIILLTTFVMLSLISSKIAVYLAPTFPFFVYLAVTFFADFRWNRWLALTVVLPGVVFAAALPALIVLAQQADTAFLGHWLFYVSAAILSVSGVFSVMVNYRHRSLNRSICILVAGLFCSLFIGGWALPSINQEIGYGTLCRKAQTLSEERRLSGYHVWKIGRPENMDVYLNEDIRELTKEEILEGKLKNTLLMLSSRKLNRDEEMKAFVSGKPHYAVGPYLIVIF